MNTDTPKTPGSKTPGTSTDPSAKTSANDVKATAADAAGDIKSKAKAEASSLADKAYDVADSKLQEGKSEATSRMDRTAEQIRNAGQEFGDDSYQAQAAEYLASNLTQAADMIRGKDLGELVDDVTEFARRNPALFLGGAALLGFAAARMMKASERADTGSSFERSSFDDSRYDRPQYGQSSSEGAPYNRGPLV